MGDQDQHPATVNGGLYTRFTAWLKHPFSTGMDAWHWVLFLGLALIVVFLWTRILNLIIEGVDTI